MTTAVQVQYRRGTSTQVASFAGAAGEMVVDTTNNRVVVQDGATAGGWPLAGANRVAVSDANYTVVPPYNTVAYTAITAARTVMLCAAANYPTGTRLLVVDESGSCSATDTITIARAGSDTIDGATSVVIKTAYGFVALESNGSNAWTIVDQVGAASLNGLIGALSIAATDGAVVAASGTTVSIGGPGGLVNKLRNGTMDVWQRGTSSLTAATSGSYTADGWIVLPTGASVTAAQAGGRLTTKNSLQVTGATSVTDVIVKQRIESLIAAAFCSQTVTVQAQVYNNTGGSITPKLTVNHAASQDNWSSPTTDVNAVSLQACTNGAWTQVAYTFSASASSYNGLEVIFDFGNNFSSSSKSIQVTECDIRVTPGVATGDNGNPPPPELRPISVELLLCQRYFQTNFPTGVASQNNYGNPRGIGFATSATNAQTIINFFAPMFSASPAIAFYSPTGGTNGEWDFNGTAGTTAVAAGGASISNSWMAVNIAATGLTTGTAASVWGWWTASAEL